VKRFVLLATVAMMPAVAMAQTTVQSVPALASVQASSSASARVAPGPAVRNGSEAPKVLVPAGMPPPVQPLAPSAPLNAKEKVSVRMAETWRNSPEKPTKGADGVLLWAYGQSLPSIVCAPLQVCDLALQAGETVQKINLGDKDQWSVTPAMSGLGTARVTHVVIKPQDAGLVTSMLIYTDQRTYSIKLISTRSEWTPLTAFSYPEQDTKNAWEQYRANAPVAAGPSVAGFGGAGTLNPANLDFGFAITGDKPQWRPVRAYTDGAKTYIQFPHEMRHGEAPALISLDHDGGWFSDPSEQMVNYRATGDLYVVDRVISRVELVVGVGGGQQKVMIERKR
jgi:P-type conjugative transfer protein TrbG